MNKLHPLLKSNLLLALVSLLITFSLYSKLPVSVPFYFNTLGQVDKWGNPDILLFTGFSPLIINLILILIPNLSSNNIFKANFYYIISFFITICALSLHLVLLLGATGYPMHIQKVFVAIFGGSLILIGTWLAKLPPNHKIGLRTRWAISSKRNWTMTHQFGSFLFVLTGIVLILSCYFPITYAIFNPMLLPVIAVSLIIFCYIYSFIQYQKQQ